MGRKGKQVLRRWGKASKESFFRRSRRKHERRVDVKALQDDLQSLNFISGLAKPEMGKEVGIRRACS